MTFNPNSEINDGEILFRAFHSDQWDHSEDRVTSGVFKSTSSISVDRDGKRSEPDIIKAFRSREFYEKCGLVSHLAEYYRAIGCKLTANPIIPENIYHALVDRENSEGTSNSIAKKLAKNARLVVQSNSF